MNTEFKVGDKVVCVDNDKVEEQLTVLKTYTVLQKSLHTTDDKVSIRNDNGEVFPFFKRRFVLISSQEPSSSIPADQSQDVG